MNPFSFKFRVIDNQSATTSGGSSGDEGVEKTQDFHSGNFFCYLNLKWSYFNLNRVSRLMAKPDQEIIISKLTQSLI